MFSRLSGDDLECAIWRPRDIHTEREKWSSCLGQWKGRGRAGRKPEGSKTEKGAGRRGEWKGLGQRKGRAGRRERKGLEQRKEKGAGRGGWPAQVAEIGSRAGRNARVPM